MTGAFRLKRGDHVVTTSVPSEAVAYRAAGYGDVKKPGPKPAEDKPAEDKRSAKK